MPEVRDQVSCCLHLLYLRGFYGCIWFPQPSLSLWNWRIKIWLVSESRFTPRNSYITETSHWGNKNLFETNTIVKQWWLFFKTDMDLLWTKSKPVSIFLVIMFNVHHSRTTKTQHLKKLKRGSGNLWGREEKSEENKDLREMRGKTWAGK